MFNLVNIVGSRLELLESIVELLKIVEKVFIFANFPIGATIQDGGKRKRSEWSRASSSSLKGKIKRNSKKRNIKSRKIDKRERKMLVSKRSITKMEYPEGCSTAIRHVARKVATMESRLVGFRGGITVGM